MDRYIDTVMIGSDRVDERARLIARLCDLVEGLVGDLGPSTPDLVRTALLAGTRAGHERPLDVVAEILVHLSRAVGATAAARVDGTAPGAGLALGLCDGRGLTDFGVAAVTGIDRDEIAEARDDARAAIGLPPAPPVCAVRHPTDVDARGCPTCLVTRADASAARHQVQARGGIPDGLVMDRVAERALAWQEDVVRQGRRPPVSVDGPSPWSRVVALSA